MMVKIKKIKDAFKPYIVNGVEILNNNLNHIIQNRNIYDIRKILKVENNLFVFYETCNNEYVITNFINEFKFSNNKLELFAIKTIGDNIFVLWKSKEKYILYYFDKNIYIKKKIGGDYIIIEDNYVFVYNEKKVKVYDDKLSLIKEIEFEGNIFNIMELGNNFLKIHYYDYEKLPNIKFFEIFGNNLNNIKNEVVKSFVYKNYFIYIIYNDYKKYELVIYNKNKLIFSDTIEHSFSYYFNKNILVFNNKICDLSEEVNIKIYNIDNIEYDKVICYKKNQLYFYDDYGIYLLNIKHRKIMKKYNDKDKIYNIKKLDGSQYFICKIKGDNNKRFVILDEHLNTVLDLEKFSLMYHFICENDIIYVYLA